MKTLETKQQEAVDRAKQRSALTPEAQLEIIETRPGTSAKERARLHLAIASRTKEKKEKKEKAA